MERSESPCPFKWKSGGDYACFSRLELKAERVSYDAITPSAARGLIEAVYWHPGLQWSIDRIRVCSPIRFTNVRRNEVKSKVLASNARVAMQDAARPLMLYTSDDIIQRAAMILTNVHYVIEVHFDILPDRAAPGGNAGKFQDIVKRRLEKGQCYHQPCFGTREFPANFKLCKEPPPCPGELRGEPDLGWMLYDLDYKDPENIQSMFFRSVMRDGVIEVPPRDSQEVRR